MSNFFKDNLINKIQTDPVMNAVFNSQQKMRSYNVVDVLTHNFGANTSTINNRRTITTPVRQGIHMVPRFDHNVHGAMVPFQPGTFQDNFGAPGGVAPPGINERYFYQYNPDLYWLNWMPQDLYNINYVNTPNPIFKALRKTPIHISSVHQSFSS